MITLEAAIETLSTENKHPWNRDNSPLREAVKLGIEALKRCRDNYLNPQRADLRRLPGETKE